ncbi:MAG: AAA family ATPase [Desulfobacteraceae bacterium]|nr:AAA family ATPase [Desulfobacteraceae bacterium]
MKIKNITILGFRGFNDERTIDFHDDLTLIYAPNSYGKTSISEAFEWLLYGVTSKVEKADSKDEYKDSYRNRHLPESHPAFVTSVFKDGENEFEFRGELSQGDAIGRFVDGRNVDDWPEPYKPPLTPKPFILQHALKYLLLVKPDDRFRGFSVLLGLEELDSLQRDFIALCTKPEAAIPAGVKKLAREIDDIQFRLENQESLSAIAKSFKKGEKNFESTYAMIDKEAKSKVPDDTDDDSILAALVKIRQEAVDKIVTGNITLAEYSAEETQDNTRQETSFLQFVTEPLIREYTDLIALKAVDDILKRAQFFDLGIDLIETTPESCPFCGRDIDSTLFDHVKQEHQKLANEKIRHKTLTEQRDKVRQSLDNLASKLETYHSRHKNKISSFLAPEPSVPQLSAILAPKHEARLNSVLTAIQLLAPAEQRLDMLYANTKEALQKVSTSISESKEDAAIMRDMGKSLVDYVSEARSFAQEVTENVPPLSDADRIFQNELDVIAGTEDIAILSDLLDRKQDIGKKFEIDGILSQLKDFRKIVDQFAARKVLDAISGELTSDVMQWYDQIKTVGDPEVHFSGFDIERTKQGKLKSRRVQIKATSYDQDLVSAVSSLSESKLNALGLCVSIASNLKSDSPFDFLIIDDPIQSWDAEHEIQFTEIIRALSGLGKQLIILTHNKGWADSVRAGCRTLNGWYYEITGYTKTGPHISPVPWEKSDQRLKEVDAILKDPNSNSVRLQQAEEEIRIVCSEIACDLYLQEKGESKSPHNLNSDKVRKMLIECSVEPDLTDRICQTYETTDDAHHASEDYSAATQRIRRYHSWCHEFKQLLN